jgi:hypothetical protein
MPSKITLTFSEQPTLNSSVTLRSGLSPNLRETFVNVRTQSFESKLGEDSQGLGAEPVEDTVLNYKNSFNTDYNVSNLYTIEYNFGDLFISITHPSDNWFTQDKFIATSGSNVTASFENTADPVSLNIESVSFSQAQANPCLNVVATITTNIQATRYSLNNSQVFQNITENPFTLNLSRVGTRIRIEKIENGNIVSSVSQNLLLPPPLLVSETSITVVNSPNGSTATINRPFDLLIAEYSLNDTDWQTSNVFANLLAGNFIAYVRDTFGCKISIPFTVDSFEETGEVGERLSYSDLPSKSNSIRFAKYINFGVCSNYKNDENTLSADLAYTQNPRRDLQLFQSCDIITTQVKTNYENIVATVIDENGNETDIETTKKSNNLGLKDRRDAIHYNIEGLEGKSGIYFSLGNVYNYDTGVVESVQLVSGTLPKWGVIGNYININNAWFQIENIIYDESKSAYVLVIPLAYSGDDITIEVKSIYNIEKYEIWEFDINMLNFNNKTIQVNITQTDSNTSFEEQVYLSEFIEVKTQHLNTLEIVYYNNQNTDIFYATGIRNKLRIPMEYIVGGYSENTESERTDTSTYLINSEAYENDLFAFQLVGKEIMRKIIQSLSHKFVFLNEVQYVKEDAPEVTPIIGTNLYRINARMTKANAVYTSKGIGQSFNSSSIEAPDLLELESDGFIKIK